MMTVSRWLGKGAENGGEPVWGPETKAALSASVAFNLIER